MTLRIHISSHDDDLHNSTAKRNGAGGLAGLDANTLIDINLLRLSSNDYVNCDGTLGNYLQKTEVGTGTITEDTTNHEFDLNCPAALDKCYFESKDTYILNSKILILNINFDKGIYTGSSKRGFIGFHDSTGDNTPTNGIYFQLQNYHGSSYIFPTVNKNSSITQGSGISTDNGFLTIIAINSKILFFVNGILKETITNNIPTVALHFRCSIGEDNFVPAGSSYSIQVINIKKHI